MDFSFIQRWRLSYSIMYPDVAAHVKDGDIVKAEIISMDAEERRIALSFRRAFEREETAEAQCCGTPPSPAPPEPAIRVGRAGRG